MRRQCKVKMGPVSAVGRMRTRTPRGVCLPYLAAQQHAKDDVAVLNKVDKVDDQNRVALVGGRAAQTVGRQRHNLGEVVDRDDRVLRVHVQQDQDPDQQQDAKDDADQLLLMRSAAKSPA